MRSSLSALAVALFGVVAATPAVAADVSGQVVDPATGSALPGANVKISGSERTTVSDASGRFMIRDIPEGTVEIVVSYVGFRTTTISASTNSPLVVKLDPVDATEIVVTGTRAAERRALQAKRASDVVQETLNSNDVGKLPDQNVAEAIRRLPGLSVADDQGEGRYVVIRGGAPNLTNVTLNGQTAAAPEPESRQVKLDDIPSSLIGSVTVVKTLTADRDANAIAGQVDINTLTAFDRSKTFVYARGAVGLNDLNGKSPYEGDLTVGSVFGPDRQFGAVISGNYSRRPIESENVQFGPRNTGAGTPNLPNDFRIRDYNLTRTRYGLVGNFDFRPSSDVNLFVRTLYSVFKDHETRDQFRIELPVATAVGTAAGSTPTDANSGTFQRARATRFIRLRDEDDSTFTVQAGGKFTFGATELVSEGTYSKAIKTDPLRSEYQFRTGTGAAGAANQGVFGSYSQLNDALPVVTYTAAGLNPSIYAFNQVNYDRRRAVEELYQGRADLKFSLPTFDGDSYIKVGAKYLQRDKTNDRTVDVYSPGTPFNLGTNPAGSLDDGLYTYNGRYQFGPRVVYDQVQAYVTANPAAYVRNANSSLSASNVADYTANEKIYAGYVMGSLTFGKLTVIPGIRVEHTEGRYVAKTLTSVSTLGPDAVVTNKYTDVFPGVNVKFDASDNLLLRGAVTTAIGRPDYQNLAPTIQVDPGSNTVTLGNALLKPYKSINGDLSAEYYLPGQGIVSLAGFYKSIDNPIFTFGQPNVSGTFAGVALTNATVTQPTNAKSEDIYGLEINLQTQLSFLPGVLSGLGVSANFTYVDGSTSGLPAGRTGSAPPFFQSKYVYTTQLFYEKGRVAARIAYSYRSRYLEVIGVNAANDTYIADHGQLDARASFQVVPQATLFVEGSNLTDSPLRRYLGNPSQVIENERYSYSVRGGVQIAF